MPEFLKTEDGIQLAVNQREEINDLIGIPPGWILRSGTVAIAIVIAAILAGTAFIKYPDKVPGRGWMNSDLPPIEHYHLIEGVIEEVMVQDRQMTEKDQPMIYLENLTSRDDLHRWTDFIDAYEAVDYIPDYLGLEFPSHLFLGELQPDYTRMQLAFQGFVLTLKQSGVFRQIRTLEQELEYNRKLELLFSKDRRLTEQEFALMEKEYQRNEYLHREKVISDHDMDKTRGELVRYQKQLNNTGQSIIQSQIRDRQLELEISRLTEDRSVRVAEHRMNMMEQIANARERIKAWEDMYYVKAKSSGIVQLEDGIVTSRRIRPGELLATIVPLEADKRRYIQVMQPGSSMAKIKEGLPVIIRFDAYPHKEYGIYKGQVAKISLAPRIMENELIYDIQIPLPDTIRTEYGIEIPFSPRGLVSAEFITEDKSILQRIMSTFLDLLKNR